jgi:hypothetical protein
VDQLNSENSPPAGVIFMPAEARTNPLRKGLTHVLTPPNFDDGTDPQSDDRKVPPKSPQLRQNLPFGVCKSCVYSARRP